LGKKIGQSKNFSNRFFGIAIPSGILHEKPRTRFVKLKETLRDGVREEELASFNVD